MPSKAAGTWKSFPSSRLSQPEKLAESPSPGLPPPVHSSDALIAPHSHPSDNGPATSKCTALPAAAGPVLHEAQSDGKAAAALAGTYSENELSEKHFPVTACHCKSQPFTQSLIHASGINFVFSETGAMQSNEENNVRPIKRRGRRVGQPRGRGSAATGASQPSSATATSSQRSADPSPQLQPVLPSSTQPPRMKSQHQSNGHLPPMAQEVPRVAPSKLESHPTNRPECQRGTSSSAGINRLCATGEWKVRKTAK